MDATTKPIIAITPYRIFPAKMGGQKGIALFYQYLGNYLPVNLVCPSDTIIPDEFPAKGFPILGTGIARYTHPRLIKRVGNVIKQTGAKIIIIEHPYLGWLANILKKRLGITVIVHSHNIEHLRFKSTGKWWWRIMRCYEKWVHGKADFNFFVTDEDKNFAISNFKLHPSRCTTITYGIERTTPPEAEEREIAAEFIRNKHQIPTHHLILFFNGTLNYKPNLDAVGYILREINSRLLNQKKAYTIIICGKGIPSEMHNLIEYSKKNIVYAGYVDDIEPYFLGADIFLNPITDGGGIKTKLVEALGYNLCAISTKSGAIGVPTDITAHKMVVIDDKDWSTFVSGLDYVNLNEKTPLAFFDHFYWGNIAKKAARCITEQV